MEADIELLLTEEGTAWAALLAAFEAVPPERFEEPTVTPEGWSPKDLMFHVGAWCGECDTQLERMKKGTIVDESTDTDARNREFFDTSKGLDAQAVRSELAVSRTRMLEALGRLDQITPTAREWFEETGVIHYGDHVRDLTAWQERA